MGVQSLGLGCCQQWKFLKGNLKSKRESGETNLTGSLLKTDLPGGEGRGTQSRFECEQLWRMEDSS